MSVSLIVCAVYMNKETVKTWNWFLPVIQIYHETRAVFWPAVQRTPEEMGAGGPALETRLDPMGVLEDLHGNILVTDRHGFVWRINPNGTAVVIAGTGRQGEPKSGIPAVSSDLGRPEGLCLDPDGNIYFADSTNHVILKIDARGILSRVAGTGWRGYSGDSGRATEARLNQPYEVRMDSRGNLYIADWGNHRVRKVDREGIITTVAGTGVAGYSGDHGAAAKAQLNGPYGIFVDHQDDLLIVDGLNHVVRRVGSSGNINTVVGTGQRGYSGDNGPARSAKLDTPQSLFATEGGNLYIDDEHNHCIRLVSGGGLITTIVGNGTPGYSADGRPGHQTQLDTPQSIWVRQDGSVLFTESGYGRVRILTTDGLVRTLMGDGSPREAVRGLDPGYGIYADRSEMAWRHEPRRSNLALSADRMFNLR